MPLRLKNLLKKKKKKSLPSNLFTAGSLIVILLHG